jgi:hypothetical protein
MFAILPVASERLRRGICRAPPTQLKVHLSECFGHNELKCRLRHFSRFSTSSELTISSFNRGCFSRHCGSLGSSHRAANAFVVVRRR